MATISVKDAAGATQTVAKVVATGSDVDANSLPVAWSTEGKAQMGSVTETAPASDTASSGLNGRLQRIAQRLTTLIGGVTLTPTSIAVSTTTTRPANVTAYTAGDVVGGAITFASIQGTAAGYVTLLGADLRYDVAAVPTGMGNMRLYLYNVTPPSATADNAAWDLPSGDRTAFIGFIDFGTPVDLGSTLFAQVTGLNQLIKLGASETSVYGYLVTANGFTPANNSETFRITLRGLAGT